MSLDLYVRCFDSLISRGPSRGPNNFYVYMKHSRTYGEVAAAYNRFKSRQKFITDRSQAMLLLWLILIVSVRPLSVFL